jgi:hypothetical protein
MEALFGCLYYAAGPAETVVLSEADWVPAAWPDLPGRVRAPSRNPTDRRRRQPRGTRLKHRARRGRSIPPALVSMHRARTAHYGTGWHREGRDTRGGQQGSAAIPM